MSSGVDCLGPIPRGKPAWASMEVAISLTVRTVLSDTQLRCDRYDMVGVGSCWISASDMVQSNSELANSPMPLSARICLIVRSNCFST